MQVWKSLLLFFIIGQFTDFAAAQLTSNHAGKLDRSFGSNGLSVGPGSISPLGGSDSVMTATGHVLYGYSDNSFLNRKIIVVKQTPEGTLDQSFGENGIHEVGLDAFQISSVGVTSLAVQPDGNIIVGGFLAMSKGIDGFLLRLVASGVVDTQFGDQGFVVLDFTPTNPVIRSDDLVSRVSVDANGKIVVLSVVGQTSTTGSFYSVVSRFDQNGNADPSFGTNGSSQQLVGDYSLGSFNEINTAIQIQGDEKVVIGVTARRNNSQEALVMRYLNNGELDTSFSDDGIAVVTPSPGASVSRLINLSTLPNGKVLVLVSTGLAQLNDDGSLDNNFGEQGYVRSRTFDFGGATPNSLLVTNDNKIIVSAWGSRVGNPNYYTVLRKYWPTGVPDIRFGVMGKSTTFPTNLINVKLLGIQADKYLRSMCALNSSACTARIFAFSKP